ncbi:hypothetical protein C8Q75DRAFT_737577 [Abortiporus biennis]|nr:hypothetical protein C8Q75DRAFT_737577 [Abortiporus biennis]
MNINVYGQFNAAEANYILPHLPMVMQLPFVGLWSISYDIYTRPTEDPLPQGWGSYRAATYKQILNYLRDRGFVHHQYSDYRNADCGPVFTFLTLINLREITPRGKFGSTVKGIKMQHIANVALQDQTHAMRLGGPLGARLIGPTPRGLVPNVVPGVVPFGNHALALPPIYTRRTPASQNPNNWLM